MELLVLFFVLLLSSSSISMFSAAVTSSSLISPSDIVCEYWFKVDEHGDMVQCRVDSTSNVIVLTKEVLSRVVVGKLNSNNSNYTIQNYPGIISGFLVEIFSGNLTITTDALAVLMPNLTKLSVDGPYMSPEIKPLINVTIDEPEVLLRMPEFRNISTWGHAVYTNDTLRAILTNGSSLQELSLGSRQFPGGLTRGVFGELKNLRHLSLSRENFTHDGAAGGGGGGLEPGAFEGLANLRVLKLAENRINHLPDGLFRDLGKVEHLDLSTNELEAIGNDSFLGMVSLSELKLKFNPIKLIEPRSFASLQNLRSLDLQMANIAYFPESVLSAQRALTKLNINGNPITNLSSTTFANLENLEVLHLSLSERLELIEPGAFDHLINLRDLYLTHNRRLRHLPDGLFQNMNKLENAFFLGCCVDNLFPSNFTHCPRMVYLKIDTCA